MTQPDVPLLVVVTGPPGGGKTTLARELAERLELPLFTKDDLKETLFDELGTGDRAWSRTLGRAVHALLLHTAAVELRAGRSLVLEANFVRGESERDFERLPPHRIAQIHCSAPPDLLLKRYRARARHPGHLDETVVHEVEHAIRAGRHDPLRLAGELIQLDTSTEVDAPQLVARVAATM